MTVMALGAMMLLGQSTGEFPHTFKYVAPMPVKSVSVAGQFNNWNKDANLMKVESDGRTWNATLNLKPGQYQYKFVVDGENWIQDPKAPGIADGNGNTNSLLIVQPPDYLKQPAKVGDGLLTASALRHVQQVPNLNLDGKRLTLTMTARPDDVESIRVVVNGKALDMTKRSGDAILSTYVAETTWDRKSPLIYAFVLKDGTTMKQLGPKGITSTPNASNTYTLDPMKFQPFEVPAWVENTVFYQIFPDRFDNANKKTDSPGVAPWTDKPTYDNRMGGDVAGLRRRMPYLKRLGVNGMYINPVMMATAYHRYDPVDFYRIDPEFGTNSEFIAMTKEFDSAGIRVVLDQIFDHVGVTFPPFADVLQFQEKSRFKDWFFIHKFPVKVEPKPNYVGWWGTEWMPKINLENPDAYAYLMESVDFWMANAKLSGWRLDVANEVPMWFWQDFRKRVKGIDRDAWIVGEVWYNADPWLKGDQWDASMNYPFRDVNLKWIAKNKIKPSEYMAGLMNVYGLYASQVSRNQLNLLSSHDTPRFLHDAGNDKRLQALAACVQMTFPGAPSIYYGEEIGMEGGADPDNRRGMQWNLVTPKNELLSLYTKLITVRTGAKVLAAGDPVPLTHFDDQNVASFGRTYGTDMSVTVINRSEKPFKGVIQLPVAKAKTRFINVLDGSVITADASGKLAVSLKPVSALVALNDTSTHSSLVKTAIAAAEKAIHSKEPMP